MLFIHVVLALLVLAYLIVTFISLRQVRVWVRQPSLFTLARQRSVSVCLFFLETMKLTFFLSGSNTAREEIIATPCCVSLVCGKGKTEEHVVLVQKQHVIVGRVTLSPCVHCLYGMKWLRKFIILVPTLSVNQNPPNNHQVCVMMLSLCLCGQKILMLWCRGGWSVTYFRKSVLFAQQ